MGKSFGISVAQSAYTSDSIALGIKVAEPASLFVILVIAELLSIANCLHGVNSIRYSLIGSGVTFFSRHPRVTWCYQSQQSHNK
jgi:hypothetical protein